MYLNLYNRITPSVLLWTPATRQVNFCTKAQRILYPEFTHAHLQHPRQIIKLNQLSLKDPFIFHMLYPITIIPSLYSRNYSITPSPCSFSITLSLCSYSITLFPCSYSITLFPFPIKDLILERNFFEVTQVLCQLLGVEIQHIYFIL